MFLRFLKTFLFRFRRAIMFIIAFTITSAPSGINYESKGKKMQPMLKWSKNDKTGTTMGCT